jgi:hypothetical protein
MSISGAGTIMGVTHADGMYVAVGDGGKVYTRGDGDTFWTLQTSGTANRLYNVAYADGRFTAVGDGGTILTSDDGANWTQVPEGASNNYNAVAGGGGIIVAVTTNGRITTCDANGVWTTQTPKGAGNLYDVIYVEGVGFAAVGYDSSNGGGAIYISQDGLNWIPQSVPDGTNSLYGITYDYVNGKFVTISYYGDVFEGTPE